MHANSRILKNSFANVVTGSSSALLNVGIPFVLAHHVAAAEFSVWALVLQLASYTAIMGLGMQVAVGRFVAFAEESSDHARASSVASTAFALLCGSAALAALGALAASVALSSLFPSIPPELINHARICLAVVGCTLSVGLPFMSFGGIFIGLQRNDIVAAITGGSRLILAVMLAALVLSGGGLVQMAYAFATVYGTSYFLQWLAYTRLDVSIRIRRRLISSSTLQELIRYCGTITFWSVAMLFVNGVDIAIVSRVDFEATATYATCAGLVAFLAGIQSALFSPILQVGAGMAARSDSAGLGILLCGATRWSSISLLAVGMPLLLFSREVISLWLGSSYVDKGGTILAIVVTASAVRLCATPYALLLLATGQHRAMLLGPALEAASNFAVSLIGGHYFGAYGVAGGALAGALVGQLMNFFYNMPHTKSIEIDRQGLLRSAIARPLFCFIPCAIAITYSSPEIGLDIPTRLIAFLGSLGLILFLALPSEERQVIASSIRNFARRFSSKQHDA